MGPDSHSREWPVYNLGLRLKSTCQRLQLMESPFPQAVVSKSVDDVTLDDPVITLASSGHFGFISITPEDGSKIKLPRIGAYSSEHAVQYKKYSVLAAAFPPSVLSHMLDKYEAFIQGRGDAMWACLLLEANYLDMRDDSVPERSVRARLLWQSGAFVGSEMDLHKLTASIQDAWMSSKFFQIFALPSEVVGSPKWYHIIAIICGGSESSISPHPTFAGQIKRLLEDAEKAGAGVSCAQVAKSILRVCGGGRTPKRECPQWCIDPRALPPPPPSVNETTKRKAGTPGVRLLGTCRRMISGGCPFGDSCRFSHHDSEDKIDPDGGNELTNFYDVRQDMITGRLMKAGRQANQPPQGGGIGASCPPQGGGSGRSNSPQGGGGHGGGRSCPAHNGGSRGRGAGRGSARGQDGRGGRGRSARGGRASRGRGRSGHGRGRAGAHQIHNVEA